MLLCWTRRKIKHFTTHTRLLIFVALRQSAPGRLQNRHRRYRRLALCTALEITASLNYVRPHCSGSPFGFFFVVVAGTCLPLLIWWAHYARNREWYLCCIMIPSSNAAHVCVCVCVWSRKRCLVALFNSLFIPGGLYEVGRTKRPVHTHTHKC